MGYTSGVKHRLFAVFCLTVLAAGCGKQMQVVLPPTPARVGAVERGVASWYGHPYHGRTTSNGERYNMHAMTAAHLSLPFDTVVRVTNVANGKSAEVRINDRGPFLKGRLIDVSRAAAEKLDMIPLGTAEVVVMVVATPPMAVTGATWKPTSTSPAPATGPCGGLNHGVQVGSFRDADNAARTLSRIAEQYGQARIVAAQTATGTLHRVVVPAPDGESAQRTLNQLQQDGIDGFVTRVDPDAACLSGDAG